MPEAGAVHAQAHAWFQRPASSWDIDEQLLAWGAVIIAHKRAQILQELGFTASAGGLPSFDSSFT
jgi:hypothetical protein